MPEPIPLPEPAEAPEPAEMPVGSAPGAETPAANAAAVAGTGKSSARVVPASFQEPGEPTEGPLPPPLPLVEVEPDDGGTGEPSPQARIEQPEYGSGLGRTPIPRAYWQPIPANCLRRMFEFQTVRDEYERTFGTSPTPDQRDDSPRLTLEDIIELTLLNSRDYQTQKEILYSTSLALSLDRFDYQLKPTVGGNGTAANYTHDRTDGRTVNTLGIPTNLSAERLLATGGSLLASFANQVVLVFGGPQGFSADVGSELLFDLQQSLLQRDIILEGLTQAERDVVYAARDFTRFRKSLFVSQARQYYNLIRQYREIEIQTQNYFSFVREFIQRESELRAGFTSRIQVDQIEQQVLGGRRSLISTCVNLESALDNLKLAVGLPTEEPINVDLTELNELTRRDELAVNGELISRVRRSLVAEREAEYPTRISLLSGATALLDRMLESVSLREELEEEPPDARRLRRWRARLRVEGGRQRVQDAREELETELEAEAPAPLIIFQRRTGLIAELRDLIGLQLDLADLLPGAGPDLSDLQVRRDTLQQRAEQLVATVETLIEEERLDELPQLVADSATVQNDAESLVRTLDNLTGLPHVLDPEQALQATLDEVDRLLEESSAYQGYESGGLVPVEIDMDDAMLTALVLRLDLINERGNVADNWRRIKLAGDDLRSVLNLRATQSVRTGIRRNRPFDFEFDNSTTRVSATFDAPLNRRAQRNGFRQSLINYQRALRQLTQLEDTIKLAVRDDLRTLSLDREQYVIDVASAALAYDRVVSTETELRLGVGTTNARDFVEAQLVFTDALSGVAGRHIGYIVNRTQLFLDLELLTVGDNGFWDELNDEQYQPTPVYQLPFYARPGYGYLHPGLKYSHRMRRMMAVPDGSTAIFRESSEDESQDAAEVAGEVPVQGDSVDAEK
jgi:outer membrane protein TolC